MRGNETAQGADDVAAVAPDRDAEVDALPSKAGITLRLMTCVLTFFLIAFGVCTFFTLTTFERLYVPLAMERYVVESTRLRDDLEAFLCGSHTVDELRKCKALRARGHAESLRTRVGRFQQNIIDIKNQYEVDGAATTTNEPADIYVSVASASKGTIYFSAANSSPAHQIGRKLPDVTRFERISEMVTHDEDGGRLIVSLPLYDVDNEKLAILSVSMPEAIVLTVTGTLLKGHHEALLMVLAVCSALLLISILLSMPREMSVETLPRKKVIAAVLLLLFLSQLGAATLGMEELSKNTTAMQAQKTLDLVTWIKDDIEDQLEYGLALPDAVRALQPGPGPVRHQGEPGDVTQVYHVLSGSGRELTKIFHNGQTYVRSPGGEAASADFSPDAASSVMLELESSTRPVGMLGGSVPETSVSGHVLRIGVDVVIALVISILCVVELLILSFKYLETVFTRARHAGKGSGFKPPRGIGSVHYSYMRPAIFLFLFGVDFSAVLIPLQMENLYEPMFGLPKDFIIALPVTAMFFSVGLTFLIAGAWMDKRGWNEPFITGVIVTGVCKMYAWMAPDAAHFIVAMGGVGFGYGLALMAAQGFVMASTNDQEKAHGIAYFFAGVYAGNIGGLAIGAMVAEHIAYEHIFLIGSMFIFASLAFSWKFLRPAFQSPELIDPKQSGVELRAANFWSFMTDRNVVSLVLFCSVPAAVAMIGFLHFFSPVYLDRLGVSESLIGGVLMLYGVSLVYISPLVSRLIDATDRKDLFIALGCGLGAVGFMSFGFLEGIAAAVTAVFFLGLSGSCLQSSQTAYTLTLKATQQLGPGKGVAYVRATSRIGQMLGPTVFSWFVIAADTERAVMNFGLVYLAIALMFILFSKPEGRPVVVKKAPQDEPPVSASPSEAKA